MATTAVCVPQLGESVREARVVAQLKKSGEMVARDEPLVEVETDKAVYVIESPAAGVVGQWHCLEDSVLPIGTLLVEVDPARTAAPPRATSERQPELARKLSAGQLACVPATIETSFRWDLLETARRERRRAFPGLTPSSVEFIAWGVVQALRFHPRLCVVLDESHTPRVREQVAIGIAVELPDDGLSVAVVRDAGSREREIFFAETRLAVARARNGEAACVPPQLIVSSLAHLGIESAIPVIVPPSIATLFVGAPVQKKSRLALTFDHRVLNGAAAARFLRDVVAEIESVGGVGKL